MSWWQKLIAKLEIGELKFLDMVEQVMREEARAKENEKYSSDLLNIGNVILVTVIAFFVLLALRFYR
jgi:hypothetical protein